MKHNHLQIIYVEKIVILQYFYFPFYSNVPNLQNINQQINLNGILVHHIAGSEHRACNREISKELSR